MSKYLQTYIFTVFFSIFCLPVLANNNVKNGVLDLRKGLLEQQKMFNINGEWEFYWKKLLTPADFSKETMPEKNFFITVPSIWNDYELDGKNLPRNGYATYRIRVLMDKPERIALKLGTIGTAFKVYVGNNVIMQAGQVSPDKQTAKPGYNSGIVVFTPDSASFDLVFQVSNYHYSKGGLWPANHKIGLASSLKPQRQKDLNIIIFLVGCIFIIAIYHLGIFILNLRNRSALYFSVFCLIYMIRTLIVGEQSIYIIFPDFNWNLLTRLEYFSLTGGLLFACLFFYDLFSEYFSKKALYIICGSALLNILIIIFAPIWLFTSLLSFSFGIILGGSAYIFWIILKGIIEKNPRAYIMTIGFIVLLFTIINDILFVSAIINTSYLSSFGFMFFIFSQAVMLSHYFSDMLKKMEKMAQKLRHLNKNLEKIVDKRTLQLSKRYGQLKEAYNQIESSNIELELQNEEIRATQERLEEQHRIVCKQRDEITDSIHYAERIQRALLPSVETFRYFDEHFVVYHPRDIVSGDFYWIEKKDNIVFFAVADCTGHGVPGAFMSMLGMAILNGLANQSNHQDTGIILNKLREKVKKALKQKESEWEQKDGMDISFCRIDMQSMTLQFSGAYQSLYIYRDNEIIKLKGDRQPIAIYRRELPFTTHEMKLEKEDVLYTFSDGFADQIGGLHKRKFMTKNLLKLLLNIYKKPLPEQKNILENTLTNWRLSNNQTDDILMAGIRI